MTKVIDFEARRQAKEPEREHERKEAKAKEIRDAFSFSRQSAEGSSSKAARGSSESVVKLKKLFKNKRSPGKK